MTAVKVQFEIGHEASIRTKKTPEGFTHDWEVFVRGQDGADISLFVDKVVFHLHETFPKPKRVVREPPFSVKESGYAGFNLPIEIYVKNKDEPKKIKFHYDLSLPQAGPATYNFLKDRYIFQNPNDEFKKKLLKGGGIIVSNNAFYTNPDQQETRSRDSFTDEKPVLGKPKLSTDVVKKHKSKEHKDEMPHRTNSFENLFGLPIQRPPKISPDPKKLLEKSSSIAKSDKKDKDRTSSDKQKQKHEHKESKPEKVKIKEEKDKNKVEKSSKSHSKDADKSKEKSNKRPSDRPISPENSKKRCISPVRKPPSPQIRSSSVSSIKDEYKPKMSIDNYDQKKPIKVEDKPPEIKVEKEVKEKKKKEKKSHDRDKERKEKKEHKKDSHKSVKESPKEPVKEPPKEIPKPREVPKEKEREVIKEPPVKDKQPKLDKPFNKFSIENLRKTPQDSTDRLEEAKSKDKSESERKHKHKKKDKKRDESREKHKESSKDKKHKHDKVKETPPSVPEKMEIVDRRETPIKPLPEPTSPISLDTASQCSSKSGIMKVTHPGVEDIISSHSESEEESITIEEDVEPKVKPPSPEVVKAPTPEVEPEVSHKEKSKKHKDKSSKREEKRRKRKAAEEEDSKDNKIPLLHGESSGLMDAKETKLQDNGVSSSLGEDSETAELSPDYMERLRELQQRIMTIKSNEELDRVVNVIAETGRYEVTTQTFDFDLCLLDRATVQQLLQLVGC